MTRFDVAKGSHQMVFVFLLSWFFLNGRFLVAQVSEFIKFYSEILYFNVKFFLGEA